MFPVKKVLVLFLCLVNVVKLPHSPILSGVCLIFWCPDPGTSLTVMGEEADLEKLEKARKAARGWATRASKALTALLSDPGSVECEAVKDAIEQLHKRVDKLDNIQSELELLTATDALDNEISQAEQFRESVRKPIIQANKLLSELSINPNASTLSVDAASEVCKVKLPILEIPKFSGDLTKWTTFWESFEALVHKSGLPTINKFTYLQSLLEGEARSVIQGLALTAANYEVAIELLQERFGKKERIVFAHIQALLNVTIVPEKGRRERSETFKEISNSKPQVLSERRVKVPSASALQTSSTPTRSSVPTCGFCAKKHPSERCWEVSSLSPHDRHHKIKEAKMCFKCLSKSHFASSCSAKCSKCKGDHHRLCCFKINENLNQSQVNPSQEKNSEGTQGNTNVVGVSIEVQSTANSAILQTARVDAFGKHCIVRANILFDTGSDRTYVSSSLVKKLKPEWVVKEPVNYIAFGQGKTSGNQLHNVYNVHLRSSSGT